MTTLRLALLTLITLSCYVPGVAQKIGFADIEEVLRQMPEMNLLEQQLQQYETELSADFDLLNKKIDQKYSAYQEKQDASAPEEELLALEQEIRRLTAQVNLIGKGIDDKVTAKRKELLLPIQKKLSAAIQDLAAKEGYTYILNSGTTSVDIVLHGPAEHDVTKKLLLQLGGTGNKN